MKRIFVTGAAISALAQPAAASWTVICPDPAGGAEIRLEYFGEESGMLNLKADFGEASVKATRETREREGNQLSGVRAFGAASLQMPDRAKVEACIVERTRSGTDEDLAKIGCLDTAELVTEPVRVSLSASFVEMAPDHIVVELQRDYLADDGHSAGLPVDVFPKQCRTEP